MTPATIFQLVITLLAAFVLAKAFGMRYIPKARYFLLLSLAVLFYACGYFLELDAHTLEAAFFSQRIQYVGVSCYAVFFYLFVRDYNNRPIKGRWKIALLLACPVLVIIFVNLWPASRLYFSNLVFVSQPSPHLEISRGPLFLLHVLYSYALISLSAVEVLKNYPCGSKEEKHTRTMFLLATVLPTVAILIFAIERLPVPMQFGSTSLVLALLILGHFILNRRAVDWLPYANESIVQNLCDGFVLLDSNDCYLKSNKAAKEYFPLLKTLAPGSDIHAAKGFPAELLAQADSEPELMMQTTHGSVWLKASATPVQYKGQVVCTCLMLYDVTELHRLMYEMEQLANSDALTGLLNRGAFFRMATRDFELARRTGQPVSLLMLDIDHFKRVNDQYGHQTGDEVLRRIATVMGERLRCTDIGGRYGGEEFCILLPSTGIAGAIRFANDIRHEIERLIIETNHGAVSVTVSAGVAQSNFDSHPSLDALISDADEALYAAKQNGRNQVAACHGPVQTMAR